MRWLGTSWLSGFWVAGGLALAWTGEVGWSLVVIIIGIIGGWIAVQGARSAARAPSARRRDRRQERRLEARLDALERRRSDRVRVENEMLEALIASGDDGYRPGAPPDEE